jgi:enamine deaminase RidA (YjgF/YER057c/UK114 family)
VSCQDHPPLNNGIQFACPGLNDPKIWSCNVPMEMFDCLDNQRRSALCKRDRPSRDACDTSAFQSAAARLEPARNRLAQCRHAATLRPLLRHPKEQAMAHIRHRKFNTKDTYPEQNLDNDLCQAVIARGRTVFLRGQCPQDMETAQNINSHDPVAQTHKVMQNIRQLLEECGGTMEHLCKVVVYLTDVRHREAVYRTMGEYIKDVHPVSTGVVVTALARPDWLVEIDGTAVIPD